MCTLWHGKSSAKRIICQTAGGPVDACDPDVENVFRRFDGSTINRNGWAGSFTAVVAETTTAAAAAVGLLATPNEDEVINLCQ